MSFSKHTQTLTVLVAVTISGTAFADAQETCRYKFLNVTNNLPSSPRSVAEAESKLVTARKFWAEAMACGPKFPALKSLADTTKAQLDKAEGAKQVLQQIDAFKAEITALAKKVATVDEKGYQGMLGAVAALEKKLEDFSSRNGASGAFREELRDLKNAVTGRAAELQQAKVAGDNKQIADAAIVPRLGFKSEDAYDQKKIQEAFTKAEAGDFVVVVPTESGTRGIVFMPVTANHQSGKRMSSEKPLKYKADVMRSEGNMQVMYETSPAAPAGLTPALVWNQIDGDRVAIVTIDGGRYLAQVASLAKGISKPESWPTAVTNDALHIDDIATLVEAKLLPATITKTFATENAANEKCNKKIWEKVQPQIDKINAANIDGQTRRNRMSQLQDTTDRAATAACGKHETAFRKAWTTAVDTRHKERGQTLASARARLTAIATAK